MTAPRASQAERVLVVDDSELTAELLCDALTDRGWTVAMASSGDEGLELAREFRPDVLVCDLNMPEMDGFEVMRRMGEIDDTIPTVMLTSYGDLDTVLTAVHKGVFDFVQKSADPDMLLGAAARAASHARVVRENRRLAGELRAANEALERRVSERTAELAAANRRLEEQALHDGLTDLPNRLLFRDRLEQALARSRRGLGAVFVLFVDLDGFKPVNDNLGHAAGDAVLVEVAARLRATHRELGTAARLSGDEFALMIEGGDLAAAIAAAERISTALAAPFHAAGREVSIGASVGIAASTAGAESVDELLRNADYAMYGAKTGSKGRHEVFAPDTHLVMLERTRLELELRHALERGEIFLQYQPIVTIATGRVVGVEALARWRHPERGVVSPVVFIPLAEKTGLIAPMGLWVLREACAEAMRLGDLGMSVNLSPRQLEQPTLVDDVARALRDTGLPPSRLTLEITESDALHEREPVLAALKGLGVALAIDDFGTGYASFDRLRRLDVDGLKIHKSFIDLLIGDARDALLGRAVLHFGRELGLKTTAEGIESPDQWTELKALGCDLGQGYLFARPLDAAALHTLHGKQRSGEPST